MAKVWRYPFDLMRGDDVGTVIAMAMMVPVVLGLAALAVDTWLWQAASRDMQSATDAAALAGAAELDKPGSDHAAVVAAARRDAAMSGFDTTSGAHVAVAIAGNDTLVSVSIRHPAPRILSGIVIGGPTDLTTKAAATKQAPGAIPRLINYAGLRAWSVTSTAAAPAGSQ